MDFKELEYILVIAQEKNISKAAERLYVSQPALSRALLKVEDRLGVSLFFRKNRQYIPTYAGELYLDMARTVLNKKHEFDRQIKKLTEENGGSISFGITPGRGRTILPKILPLFREAFPGCELRICEGDIGQLERSLRDGTIEFAFFTMLSDGEKNGNLHYERISREEIVLCTAKTEKYGLLGSPKQGRKYPWIDLKLLKNETFLLLKNNMRLGQFSEKVLSEYGMTPEIMELNSIDTALALVGQQYGVAFACGFKLEEHANAKEILVFSFGEETPEWDFVAAFDASYAVRRPARYLVDLMKGLNDVI